MHAFAWQLENSADMFICITAYPCDVNLENSSQYSATEAAEVLGSIPVFETYSKIPGGFMSTLSRFSSSPTTIPKGKTSMSYFSYICGVRSQVESQVIFIFLGLFEMSVMAVSFLYAGSTRCDASQSARYYVYIILNNFLNVNKIFLNSTINT